LWLSLSKNLFHASSQLGFHISQPSTFLSFLFIIGREKLGLTSKDVEEEPSPPAEAQERLEFIE
jgi:hypothetical protein